ncbi:ABC transporter permease [Bifidobacterium apousia]|uniref:ABC transporter permease n=1 Tax=Bifidobacterium apousia TaxID=2750996 RepID=UPI0018DDE720|nr:ABC transporter permease [Bifidobacterium apousia]MBI0062867.1 ABC transporter permease [Bifidobacterium apousia]
MNRQYPANAITITPMHRHKPSIAAAFKWEIRKAGNLWYWLATMLFDSVGIFNGWDQYQSYRADFQAQGVTWAAVWGQAILLPSMVFMPVLVAAFAAQVESNEHKGRNWQRLNASGMVGTALAGKVMHGLLASLLTVAIFESEFILVGVLVGGFSPVELGPYLMRGVPMTLAVWAIMTLTQAIAARAESFASTMSIMFLLTLAGCALSLAAPSLALPYPLALITTASAARDMGNIASTASMAASCMTAILWVLISLLIFRHEARRAV